MTVIHRPLTDARSDVDNPLRRPQAVWAKISRPTWGSELYSQSTGPTTTTTTF
jgi:hypothetical protein